MYFTKRQRQFFFGLILFSGLFFCLVVPPFQTPDEFNHSFKIHHLADGHFFAEIDTPSVSLGGTIPKSLITTSQFYESIVFSEKKAPLDSLKRLITIPLDKNDRDFVVFPNTARYAFTSYLATIPIIYVGNFLDLNPIFSMYWGRIFNFLFWFGCIVLGFRIMPIFKELYLFLCLLPGTISIHASLSADTVSNGFLFLLIALFFDFKFSKRPISNLKLIAYFILTLLVAWNKIVYFPMLFLLFFVPKEHFGSSFRKFGYGAVLLASVLAIVFYWNHTIDKYIYPFGDTYKNTYHNLHEREDGAEGYENVNPRLQIERIKQNPIGFLGVFLPAVLELYSYNNKTYISNVGWESKTMHPDLNNTLVIVFLIYILSLPNLFNRKERLFFVALAFLMSILFLLSQHLHWDAVGEKMINGYLGKYFIAIYPLLFFAFSGLFNLSEKLKKYRINIPFLLGILFILAHLNMYYLTFKRFY
jgi:uncharacterized membrane protein